MFEGSLYLTVLQLIVARAACLYVSPEAFLFCVLPPHRRTLRCLRCRKVMQSRLSKARLKAVPGAYFGVLFERTAGDQSQSSNSQRSHARVPSEAVVQGLLSFWTKRIHVCLATESPIRKDLFRGRSSARTVIIDAGHRLHMLLMCTC